MKLASLMLSLLLLISCAPGSDDAGLTLANSANQVSTIEFDDLTASRDFDFIGGESLTINVMYESAVQQRLYLNICKDFQLVDGQYQVNYDSCLLRTSLQGQNKEFNIALSEVETVLLAQVWSLVEGATPQNYLWDSTQNRTGWQISVR